MFVYIDSTWIGFFTGVIAGLILVALVVSMADLVLQMMELDL